MSSKTFELIRQCIAALYIQDENPYSIPYRKPDNPYKPSTQNKKNLQTFLIKGQEIQAYNKKDALKRYQHQNKKK